MNKLRQFIDKCGGILEAGAVKKERAACAPEELHIELTYRCNTSCIMCNLRYINKPENEPDTARWIEVIKNSKLLKGVRFIVLSGGEPWLKEGFVEFVAALRANYPGISILILSNLIDAELALGGILKIKKAVGLGNISLGSSIDGIGDHHDRIRNKNGSFELFSNTLERVKKEYPELHFTLNFTLTPENCGQMVAVYDWCAERSYHVSFQVMVQKKETKKFEWKKEHLDIISAQLDELTDKMAPGFEPGAKNAMALITNEGLFSLITSIHYIEKYVRSQRRFFPNCPCGSKYAMLDPYGNLYFCPVHKSLVAGNVFKDGFDALWNSQKAGEISCYFAKRECDCWLTCTNGYMIGDAIRASKDRLVKECLAAD